MQLQKKGYLLVNFGGPRNIQEIPSFLETLLTDKEVIRTKLPSFLQDFLFKRIAKKRALKIQKDYELIGGKSPIFEDTEWVAEALRDKLDAPLLTFHRYIPATHRESLQRIEQMEVDKITVFPLFPQFTYATTGSIARFFCKNLSRATLNKLRWIKSYPTHPAYIQLIVRNIREYLHTNGLQEEEVAFLFSAHGLPKEFIDRGDLYECEIESSFYKVMEAFPNALGKLAYQSKFGPGEWLRPYTEDVCREVKTWSEGRKTILFIPISFTSDHIETLFEIETLYMPLVAQAGFNAHRLGAFNQQPEWVEVICQIMAETTPTSNCMLTRCSRCK